MKKLSQLLSLAVVLVAVSLASAQEFFVYENMDTPSGAAYFNGGAAADPQLPANTITRLVADDLTPISGYAGQPIQNLYWSTYNGNATPVSARMRLRMWDADGAGGGPGTFYAGYTFSPVALSGSQAWYFHPETSPGVPLNLPNGTFWIGLTFDNSSGTTLATAAQLDNLGMLLYNPPTVGTSADIAFQTTSAGSFVVNNPAGSFFDLGGDPVANFFFGVSIVPEPSVFALLGLAGAGLLIFRRRQ
jgi:hypothetical protein